MTIIVFEGILIGRPRTLHFSNNVMAVNCIHTDVQARMNGEDSKIRVGSEETQFKNDSVNCGKPHFMR